MALPYHPQFQIRVDEKKFTRLKDYALTHHLSLQTLYREALVRLFQVRHRHHQTNTTLPYFAATTTKSRYVNVYITEDLWLRVNAIAEADAISRRAIGFTALTLFIDSLATRKPLPSDDVQAVLTAHPDDIVEIIRQLMGPALDTPARITDLLKGDASSLARTVHTLLITAPAVQNFIASGYTDDVEGLLALDRLYQDQPETALRLMIEWDVHPDRRVNLAAQVKACHHPLDVPPCEASRQILVTQCHRGDGDFIVLDTPQGPMQLILSEEAQRQLVHAVVHLNPKTAVPF